jgi:sulfur carrier protein ThiS
MESIAYGHDSWNNLNLEGKTVGAALDQYATVFNLPTDATVMVNGESVGRDHLIEGGDTVEIVRATGQKG